MIAQATIIKVSIKTVRNWARMKVL